MVVVWYSETLVPYRNTYTMSKTRRSRVEDPLLINFLLE